MFPSPAPSPTSRYSVSASSVWPDRLRIADPSGGFELANGLLPWARQLVLASPSRTRLSVDTRSLVGVRARYVQPFEDHVLGGGVTILDASIDRIERTERSEAGSAGSAGAPAMIVRTRPSDGGDELAFEVDAVISATGFVCPLLDLPDLGVSTFGASRLPVQTPWWESADVPGIHFAGTIGQGARGLQRHGMPSNSGAAHGARYNARLLAQRVAAGLGSATPHPAAPAASLIDFIATELTEAPDLWHQRGYLARVVTLDPVAGLVDDGVQPLAHVLDAGGPDAIAATLEADGSGAIYPVIYTRTRGAIAERTIEPDPLLRYDGVEARRAIAEAVRSVAPGTAAG